MAGHSQFKNIMHRKGAQDAKRAKVFTKLIRELTVSAKEGDDASSNPRLRAAISAAREANMPKDTVDRAIRRGAGHEEGSDYHEVRYEGYGSGGVAVIVEVLTDNKNRSAADIRSYFNKFGGSLGETNSVSFQFNHLGLVSYPASKVSADAIFEAALEAGADDVESTDETHDVFCSVENFHTVRESLAEKFGDPMSAKLIWKPQNLIEVKENSAESLIKLLNILEDYDDVQTVFSNFDMSPELMEKLSAS
jgi:YebC/PmpR family DNA-binding regulatory protein